MKNTYLILLTLLPLGLLAQAIPQNANKIDKNGLRQGTWTILYDENWETISNPAVAAFYRIITYKKGKPKGLVKDYYRDGRLQWEATLLADEPESIEDGKVTWYHENGQISQIAYYKEGVSEGDFISYYESGKVYEEAFYKEGKLEGEYTTYYENGNIKVISEYENGILQGQTKWYYESGERKESSYYKNGSKEGLTKVFYQDGSLYSEHEYQNGHTINESFYNQDGSNYEFDFSALYDKAIYHREKENYQMELQYWLAVKDTMELYYGYDTARDDYYALILAFIGNDYFYLRDYNTAEDYYKQSLTIYEQTNPEGYATMIFNLIASYESQRNFEKVIQYRELLINRFEGQLFSDTLSKQEVDSISYEYTSDIIEFAQHYSNLKKNKEQINTYQRAINFYQEISLKDRNYTALQNRLGLVYLENGDYEQAEPLFLLTLDYYGETEEHTGGNYINTLSNLYVLYDNLSQDSLALQFAQEKRRLLEQNITSEQDKKDYLIAISQEYNCQKQLNNLDDALILIKLYANVTQELYGENSQDYALALNEYADLLDLTGETELANQTYQQAISVSQNIYGGASFELGNSIQNLGDFYFQKNRFKKAEETYLQSLSVYAQTSRQNHPRYTDLLYNLGWIKYSLGDYLSADQYYLQAQEIEKRERGIETFTYQEILTGFGLLYRALGDYEKAKAYLEEALSLAKKRDGERSRNAAICMDNLALVYSNEYNYEKAIELNEEALSILKEILGQNHKSVAISIGNLASLYDFNHNYDKANELFTECFEVFQQIEFPEKEKLLASIFNNFAMSRQRAGRFEVAEEFYQHSLDRLLTIYGESHPKYLATVVNKANLYRLYGKDEQAKELYEFWFPAKINQYQNIFPSLSDNEKRQFVNSDQVSFSNFNLFGYWVNYKNKPNIEGITQDWYNLQLSLKGILLNASQKARNQILNSGDPILIEKYQAWQNLKDYIAQVANYSLDEREEENIDLQALENEANEMEAELSNLSSEFANAFANEIPTWEGVQNTLKANEAAIEMVRVEYTDTTGATITAYAALILMKDSDGPEVVILEEGARMETAYLRFYKNIINSQKKGGKRDDKNSYAVFWQPIHQKLMELTDGNGVEKIYFSPEKVYNEINVNTLYDTEREKYVIDDYDVHILTSTRELMTMERKSGILPKDGTAYLFGRPDYILEEVSGTTGDTTKVNVARGSTQFVKQISQASWSDLPGTEKEIRNISKVFDKAKYDYQRKIGEEVTEEAVESLVNPSILHIATHGFFMPTEAVKEDPTQALLQSGLVLSGVTDYFQAIEKPDREDGVLTAYEAMNMQLDETSLVVLSACETGTGEVQAGEGVYGLQRALKVAGANTLLMSLWKVNDEATQELMSTFYEEWIRTNDKREAFRNAQLKLREKYPQHYYWGAFVMIGE